MPTKTLTSFSSSPFPGSGGHCSYGNHDGDGPHETSAQGARTEVCCPSEEPTCPVVNYAHTLFPVSFFSIRILLDCALTGRHRHCRL